MAVKNKNVLGHHLIQGDGNCLFRALSYVITGVQSYHSVVRHKILDHMKEIEVLLVPHMNVFEFISSKQ